MNLGAKGFIATVCLRESKCSETSPQNDSQAYSGRGLWRGVPVEIVSGPSHMKNPRETPYRLLFYLLPSNDMPHYS